MDMSEDIAISMVREDAEYNQNGDAVLKVALEYPQLMMSGPTQGVRWINQNYMNQINVFWNYIKTKLLQSAISDYNERKENNDTMIPHEVNLNFYPSYQDNCTVSFYYDEYEYTGGAHGSTVRNSDTWNYDSGYTYQLKDFFPYDMNYRSFLINEIINQINDQVATGDQSYFDNYAELVHDTFQARNYYLTPEGIVIYFQQYDIAPYSSGIREFLIPYQSGGYTLPKC